MLLVDGLGCVAVGKHISSKIRAQHRTFVHGAYDDLVLTAVKRQGGRSRSIYSLQSIVY